MICYFLWNYCWVLVQVFNYIFGVYLFIKFFSGKVVKFNSSGFQCSIFIVGFFGNFSCFIVINFGIQGCYQYQVVVEVFLNVFCVRFDIYCIVVVEVYCSFFNQVG